MFLILLTVLFIIIAVLVIAALQPGDFRYTRSGSISAPVAAVFPHVNDLHLWNAWSPWARMDPDCKNSFEGAAQGKGAVMKWDGNNKVGSGMMTIMESRPPEFVQMQLQFFRPFKATHMAEFTLTAQGSETLVTWTMYGKNNFMGKLVSLVMNCDKMIGGQFSDGLANLKTVVETK